MQNTSYEITEYAKCIFYLTYNIIHTMHLHLCMLHILHKTFIFTLCQMGLHSPQLFHTCTTKGDFCRLLTDSLCQNVCPGLGPNCLTP